MTVLHPFARLLCWLALVFALAGALPALAAPVGAGQSSVQLPHGDGFVQPFARTRYFVDQTGTMAVEEVIASRNAFRPIRSRWIDFGAREGRVWLLVRVRNDHDNAGRWMIDLQRQWVDALDVYRIGDDDAVRPLMKLTAQTPLSDRPVKSRYIAAQLDMEAGENAEILVGYASRRGSWLPLTFATPERFRLAHLGEERINWTLNGALAILIAIALALGRIAGWRLAIAYCAYALAGGLLVANNEGYLFEFLWPGLPSLYDRANLVLLCALIGAGLWFSRVFAGLAEHYPRADRALTGFLAVVGLLLVLAAFLPDLTAVRLAIYAVIPLGAAGYLTIAALAVKARILGAVPFVIGAVALSLTLIFTAAVMLFPGRFALTVALDYIHATVLIEGLAFLIALVLRILRIREALNRALAAELESTQEKLRLSSDLAESQRRYNETRRLAEARRARLASASHDLQQPLISLRRSLAEIGAQDSDEREKAAAALDYLERLTNEGLAESRPPDLSGEAPDEGKENFPIAIIVANCRAMFAREAEENGMDLRALPIDDVIRADPVIVMRIASNLVSNALKHSDGSEIVIAAHGGGETVTLEVRDNGRGLTEQELADLQQAYRKGADSDGQGLGLHLVHTLCAEQGIALDVESEPGGGTAFRLHIARGD